MGCHRRKLPRRRASRALFTSAQLARHFMGRFVLGGFHFHWDDLVFTEQFNRYRSGKLRDAGRHTTHQYTREETTALLVEVMRRERFNFATIREARKHVPQDKWKAIDSAVSVVFGCETVEEREERRKAMGLRSKGKNSERCTTALRPYKHREDSGFRGEREEIERRMAALELGRWEAAKLGLEMKEVEGRTASLTLQDHQGLFLEEKRPTVPRSVPEQSFRITGQDTDARVKRYVEMDVALRPARFMKPQEEARLEITDAPLEEVKASGVELLSSGVSLPILGGKPWPGDIV